MMDVVARQATHIASIVLATLPVEMASVHRVALEAGLIRLCGTPLSRIADIAFAGGLGARLSVFVAVRVTDLALGAP